MAGNFRNRRPAGQTTGGQFAPTPRPAQPAEASGLRLVDTDTAAAEASLYAAADNEQERTIYEAAGLLMRDWADDVCRCGQMKTPSDGCGFHDIDEDDDPAETAYRIAAGAFASHPPDARQWPAIQEQAKRYADAWAEATGHRATARGYDSVRAGAAKVMLAEWDEWNADGNDPACTCESYAHARCFHRMVEMDPDREFSPYQRSYHAYWFAASATGVDVHDVDASAVIEREAQAYGHRVADRAEAEARAAGRLVDR